MPITPDRQMSLRGGARSRVPVFPPSNDAQGSGSSG